MSRDLNLNGMLYFEAVARHGRVSKAAEELGVSPSAVSQQIKLLEQQFGVRLFRRDKRLLSLTIDGERLYQTTSAAFRMIREARQVVARQRENWQLIVRVSPSFGVRWLGPRLADFIQQHPSWDLRIDAAPDPSDFEREVVDLDLRYGGAERSGLYVEQVLTDYVLPMCSPAYRDALAAQTDDPAEMIRQARLIYSVKTQYGWDAWLARNGITHTADAPALRFERSSMALQVATKGVGVALDSVTLARDELISGTLVPLSPAFEVVRFPAYWIVSPSRHQSRRVVRLFCDWLRDQAFAHDEEARRILRDFGCAIAGIGDLPLLEPEAER